MLQLTKNMRMLLNWTIIILGLKLIRNFWVKRQKSNFSQEINLFLLCHGSVVKVSAISYEKKTLNYGLILYNTGIISGAPFHVKSVKSPATTPESPASITNFSELMGDEIPKLYFCKLTSDQKFLIFYDHDDNEDAKNGSAMDPLEVAKIIEIQPNTDDRSFSINLRVKINTSEEMTLQLDSPPEPSRKPSVLWLSALRKVWSFSN